MPKSQGKIKRTKSGCISCRLSRKKCDETKPVCQLCSKKDIQCIWGTAKQTVNQFINDNGIEILEQVTLKTQRRSRNGCIACSKAKKKCDENKPQCNRCVGKQIQCVFKTAKSDKIQQNLVKEEHENLEVLRNNNQMVIISENLALLPLNNVPFDHLFNIFFNVTIKSLVPKESLQVISELTLETFRKSTEFRDILTSLSAAYLFSVDRSKHAAINGIHKKAMTQVLGSYNKSDSFDWVLHSIIFSILSKIYMSSNNEELLKDIYTGVEFILSKNNIESSRTIRLLIESLFYHYSVSILITPLELLNKYHPFILCDILRSYFPDKATTESNLLLGETLDVLPIVAKTSFLFRKKSYKNKFYSTLMMTVNDLLKKKIKSSQKMIYITLIGCKMLLLDVFPYASQIEKDGLKELFFSVFNSLDESDMENGLFKLWGIFIIGLTLENKIDQDKILSYLKKKWEITHNVGDLRAIDNLKLAWNQNRGLEMLENEMIVNQIFLS